jgi:fructose-bisphosphate aldolase class II
MKALESLIDEAIAAEFYNIDIDTSTLVDLDFDARRAAARELRGHRAPHEVHPRARAEGDHDLHRRRDRRGRQVQHAARRGARVRGRPEAPPRRRGRHQQDLRADRHLARRRAAARRHGRAGEDRLRRAPQTTEICRSEYGIGGSVQHGASTLPESVFNKFPESEAVEIHLATGFQNMVLDAPTLPQT